jgi:hypothetical protein
LPGGKKARARAGDGRFFPDRVRLRGRKQEPEKLQRQRKNRFPEGIDRKNGKSKGKGNGNGRSFILLCRGLEGVDA